MVLIIFEVVKQPFIINELSGSFVCTKLFGSRQLLHFLIYVYLCYLALFNTWWAWYICCYLFIHWQFFLTHRFPQWLFNDSVIVYFRGFTDGEVLSGNADGLGKMNSQASQLSWCYWSLRVANCPNNSWYL